VEILDMRSRKAKATLIVASVAVLAAASTLPAAAKYQHGRLHRPHHARAMGRPLTVSMHVQREPVVVAPDPFSGPAAIITGPVALGAAIVSVPFRAAATIFPTHGDPAVNPLVLVGAPVHVAGQFLQLPFYAVGSAFGAPPSSNF
jgi:hypothetical protein